MLLAIAKEAYKRQSGVRSRTNLCEDTFAVRCLPPAVCSHDGTQMPLMAGWIFPSKMYGCSGADFSSNLIG